MDIDNESHVRATQELWDLMLNPKEPEPMDNIGSIQNENQVIGTCAGPVAVDFGQF